MASPSALSAPTLPPTVPTWLRAEADWADGAGAGGRGRFRRNRERETSHAKAFRQWLVRTVGIVRLCQGCGVIDVAGGKGQLSFELLNLKAVPTTVVDPRPLNVAKYCTAFRMGHYGRQPAGAAPQAPRHIQRFWEPALWEPRAAACPVQRQLQEAWHRAHGAELQRASGRDDDAIAADRTADPVPRTAPGNGPAASETAEPVLAGIEGVAVPGPSTGAAGEVEGMGGGGGGGASAGGAGGTRKKGKTKPRFRGVFFDAQAAHGQGAFAACIRAGV